MKKYVVVMEKSIERFQFEVNDLINDGWELQGGVSHSNSPNGIIFLQSLIKVQ
ncbi:DUF1737 domain-containing protein [Aquimarina sp. 2201CG1-2-11]|uniref:DUF1737 domain-containing protein n=1 Tax=Aquimarina discodermiae TaxID=3231043 RepID=UPI0034629883